MILLLLAYHAQHQYCHPCCSSLQTAPGPFLYLCIDQAIHSSFVVGVDDLLPTSITCYVVVLRYTRHSFGCYLHSGFNRHVLPSVYILVDNNVLMRLPWNAVSCKVCLDKPVAIICCFFFRGGEAAEPNKRSNTLCCSPLCVLL